MQYSYRQPSQYWRSVHQVSIGIHEVVPAKNGIKNKGAFLLIKAAGHEFDKLCMMGDVVVKALNDGTLKRSDFITSYITLQYLIALLEVKLGRDKIESTNTRTSLKRNERTIQRMVGDLYHEME